MAREVNKLTARTVATKKEPGYYSDGLGLYLQITPNGSKSWIFRYKSQSKPRYMGLGSVHAVSLEAARDKATQCRQLLAEGIDPLKAKELREEQERAAKEAAAKQRDLDQARAVTFQDCAKRYIESNKAKWKNAKHVSQWENTLEQYCGPVFGNLPVSDVDTGLVLKVLEPIWVAKHETATRLRARIEAVLDAARVRGFRAGENPARWRGHLENLLPGIKKRARVKHHPALHYTEISQFMADLRQQEGFAAKCLEFVILTACRTGEAIAAKPTEFDLPKGVWTIPGSRMKAGKEHRAALCPRAIEIVEQQLTLNETFVFPGKSGKKPMSNMAMLKLLERMGRDDLTVHGFRSSFRDWAAECTDYPREVAEMALAHTIGDQTEAAYRRGDLFEKRKRLMLEWQRFCLDPQAGKALKSGKVARIGKAA